jgi:hypothetical protein
MTIPRCALKYIYPVVLVFFPFFSQSCIGNKVMFTENKKQVYTRKLHLKIDSKQATSIPICIVCHPQICTFNTLDILHHTILSSSQHYSCLFYINYLKGSIFHMFPEQNLDVSILILRSSDVHRNPGPASRSTSTSSLISSLNDYIGLSRNLSLVHYNVQSLLPKLDKLMLNDFYILVFSKTWLNVKTPSSDLILSSYSPPERKYRIHNYGGVILYVKDNISYKRRLNLEIWGTESTRIEIIFCNKHILLGAFYRPPNTDSVHHDLIVDSMHLAMDTHIDNILI